MKRLLLLIVFCVTVITLSGQNTFKYQIYANGGLSVGTGNEKIDSITVSNDTIYFFRNGTRLYLTGTVDTTSLSNRIDLKVNIADTSAMLSPYSLDAELDALETSVYDTIEISSVVPLLADTIPLVVFGGGSGNEADTAVFTTSTIYGSFRNAGSDTLVITGLNAVMGAGTTPLGTDTLGIDICWADTLKAVVNTKLNTTTLGINSTTVGTVDTSFDNAKIPPGVRVWMVTPTVTTGRKPNYVEVTLYGYKIPTY